MTQGDEQDTERSNWGKQGKEGESGWWRGGGINGEGQGGWEEQEEGEEEGEKDEE